MALKVEYDYAGELSRRMSIFLKCLALPPATSRRCLGCLGSFGESKHQLFIP